MTPEGGEAISRGRALHDLGMETAMKSLLVHFDGSPQSADRLALARQLGEPEGARVVALFAVTLPRVEAFYPGAADGLPLQWVQDLYAGWRQRGVVAFETANLGCSAVWAESGMENDAIGGFAEQAFYADLLVLGQRDPQAVERLVPGDFVSAVLIASGRPAIVLPHAGSFPHVGRRVLVAWKPTPQSARALTAALPLLRRADHVTVVEWGAKSAGCRGAALDVELYLRLHGVQAIVERDAREPHDVGELLLARADGLDADLLVLGCYGHSRARELVLGGVTRTVLRSMTRPVLFCH